MLSLKKISLLLALFSLFGAASVKAQTIIPAADGTGTIITRDGQRITIDGGTLSKNGENLFHSFQEFGLSPEQIANFLANPQLQNILSRVTGGNPSVIRGLIEVTGGSPNLYLMNPAGIIFGENARLNVPADFTATTATGIGFEEGWFSAIGDNNYSELVGSPNQFIFNTDNPSAIINAGDLAVSEGNSLTLAAGSIANTGTLTAQNGNIIITAVPGKNLIRISQKGHILSLEIVPPDTETGEWNLSAYDLPALLTGDNVPETGLAVAEDGVTVTLKETVIPTASGSSAIAGELNTNGETGGNIYVLGENVGLYEAQLSADGVNGGGNLFIGGNYQGEGPLPNAQRTFVSEGSQLSANALVSGDGGQAIVWSDDRTAFFGEISARGGEQSGNGGFVEISGKQALAFNGQVDVSAAQGEAGTVLFDPRDIIIEAAASSPNDSELSDGQILFTDGGTDTDFIISDTALTSLQGNIILEASRDLIANAQTNLNFVNQTSGESLTFTAERNFDAVNTSITTNGADVNFTANTGTLLVQDISTSSVDGASAGTINLTALDNIVTGNLDAGVDNGNGGAIRLNTSQGGIDTTAGILNTSADDTGNGGVIELNALENVQTGTLDATANVGRGGNISITSDNGSLNLNGNLETSAEAGNGGGIALTAENDVTALGTIASASANNSGNVTVSARTGEIDLAILATTAASGTGGGVNLEAAGNIAIGQLAIGSVEGEAQPITINTPETVTLIGQSEILGSDVLIGSAEAPVGDFSSVNNLNTQGGNFSLFVGSDYTLPVAIFTGGGNVNLDSPQNLTLASTIDTDGGNINIVGATVVSSDAVFTPLDSSNLNGEGGEITVNAEGEINLGNLNASAVGETGSGGDVFLESTGNLAINTIVSRADNFTGDGGDITLTAGGTILTSGLDTGGLNGNGGAIILESITGNLDTTTGILNTSAAGDGNAGTIDLNASGNIATGSLSAIAENGNGGAITVATLTGDIQITDQMNTSSQTQDAGNITLTAGGSIDASIGDELTAATLDADLDVYTLSALGGDNGGNITLEAGGDISAGFMGSLAENGTGGDITLNSPNGEIKASYTSVPSAGEAPTEVGIILSVSEQGDGGDVTMSALGNIGTGSIGTGSLGNGVGGEIRLNSETGSIDTTATLLPSLLAGLGLSFDLAEAVSAASGEVGLLFSGSNEGTGGDVELTAQGDINTGAIVTGTFGEDGGNVTLTSNNGSVNTSFDALIDRATEEQLLQAGVDPDLASLLAGAAVRLGIITFSEEAQGGDVIINAEGDIITSSMTTGSFRADGGDIALNSETGSIDGSAGRFLENVSTELLEELDAGSDVILIGEYFSQEGIGGYLTFSLDQNAGDIDLSAQGDITTNYLISSSFSGEGGTLTVDTENGAIAIGSVIFNAAQGIFSGSLGTENEELEIIAQLLSGGSVNTSGAIGGEIMIGNLIGETVENATGEINAVAINSSGRLGDGGDMTLASDQDIAVTTLNAQGGETGIGGAIAVTTEEFFRATETLPNETQPPTSISSIGGAGGGDITIRHGGDGEIPFVVGDAELNGTAGEITSGEFEIPDGSFLFTEERGNIRIISVSGEPELEVPPELDPETLDEDPVQQSIVANPQPTVQLVTEATAQEVLQNVDRASGIKPALIYINFVPQTLAGVTDFQRQEALSTQDYENYFDLPQRKADNTLSVPRQPDDQLEILLVTEAGEPFRITVEGATREDVTETAQELYGLISTAPSPFALRAKPYLEPAQQLYDWLIEPLEATLSEQEIENLVFIMPAGLRLLPVAALHDGEQFLVESYSVGFSPSLSLTDTRYKDIQDLEVFAAGAANFNDPTALGPLPAVTVELPLIASELWRGEFELNEQFTLENFLQQRRRNPKGIIHLATHADFRSGNPEEIYIQFYDQKVRLDEIRQLNLNDPPVELLVLSACRTAVGDEQIELGFAGLTVQAGVKSAMASLWYVGDTGTLALMSEFYRQLNTAPIKAEAMRRAQVGMITGEVRLEGEEIIIPQGTVPLPPDVPVRAEDLSHPYYWAAFTMVGSPW